MPANACILKGNGQKITALSKANLWVNITGILSRAGYTDRAREYLINRNKWKVDTTKSGRWADFATAILVCRLCESKFPELEQILLTIKKSLTQSAETYSHISISEIKVPDISEYPGIVGKPTEELVRNWVREDASRKPQVAINVGKLRMALRLDRGTGRNFVSTRTHYIFNKSAYISLPDATGFIAQYAPTDNLIRGFIMKIESDMRVGG